MGRAHLSHLLLHHAEFLVHCFEVVSVEAGSVEQLLEVPERDPAHRPHDARHERGDRPRGEIHDLGRHAARAWAVRVLLIVNVNRVQIY